MHTINGGYNVSIKYLSSFSALMVDPTSPRELGATNGQADSI
jgi:hypothetical protein